MLHPSTRRRFGAIVTRLLAWHAENQRSFIWRGLDRSPYVVLVSEFMMQQTGAKQVEKKLPEFLKEFPSIKKLAAAPRAQVVRAWHGLGYNRRALNLHAAAKALSTKRQFPNTLEELRELPGVGLYTASAILSFAYNTDTPVVDVNIERVLSRLWKRMSDTHATLPIREIYELDAAVLPQGRSSMWHETLMDLGSSICTKNAPKCPACPMQRMCPSSRSMKLPSSRKKGLREPVYFGEPRRIWRGRILKLVTEKEPITKGKLTTLLKQKFAIADTAFAPFVLSVLTTLQKEGFLTQTSKGALTLAHE